MGWIVGVLLVLVIALGGAAWWWIGTPQSLGTVLAYAVRHLPAGQSLEVRDVDASVLGGGHIGWLRWQGPTLSVEVRDLQVGWNLRPLIGYKLVLTELRAAQVTATPKGPPSDKPTEPLTGVVLPIDIDAPFEVHEIRWMGSPELTVKALSGHYTYANSQHLLRLAGVDVADGHYEGQVKLQGPAPMAIEAALKGRVQAPMPEGTAPFAVLADASVKGALAHRDAKLLIAAKVAPAEGADAADAMRAALDAEIAPWVQQPVLRAKADFTRIDAARFWPTAPITLLSGQLEAGPVNAGSASPRGNAGGNAGGTTGSNAGSAIAGTVWQAHLTARNAAPGPWNVGKLPVTMADVSARYDGKRWDFPPGTVEAGDGQVQFEGTWSPAPAPWQVAASVRKVKPALLYSGLDATPISGKIGAAQRGDAIAFDVDVKSEAAPRSQPRNDAALNAGVRIDQAIAQGSWQGQTLDLKTLRIDAGNARVVGRATARIDTKAGEGQLDLTAPGATARVAGKIAPAAGALQLNADVKDAAMLQRWVEGLPSMATAFAGAGMRGAAQVDARWQGGWQALQKQVEAPSTPQPGLNLQLALKAPQFDVQLPGTATTVVVANSSAAASASGSVSASASTPAAQPSQPPATAAAPPAAPGAGTEAPPVAAPPGRIQLRDLRLELAGSPADVTLSLDGSARFGTQQFSVATKASGGMAARDQWRVALASLRLRAKLSPDAKVEPWSVELDKPLNATFQKAATGNATGWRVEASAGDASIHGPVAGTARLQWQPLLFVRTAVADASTPARMQLRSQGKLTGLPLAWAEALGANLDLQERAGISGDLVFDGAWDVDAADTLRASIKLARASGDIRVRAGESAQIRRIETTGTGTKSETRFDNGLQAGAPATPAGLRKAEIEISAQGDAVRAQLTWDSERAGQLTADLRTSVAQQDGSWTWPEAASLSGKVQARMPDVGVWSVLAPPAWRINGTLAADATLAGTRVDPQWNGTLSADKLSVKAAVEGIELQDGKLRATLRGNRLQIDEFTLAGGSASRARIAGLGGNLSTVSSESAKDGGDVKVTGEVSWGAMAAANAQATGPDLQMNLQAQLRALRVLVRSDRQVTVSGNVSASLDQGGQLLVRGVARADRGVIILADESAPTLGTDVSVRSAAIDKEAAAARARTKAAADTAAARATAPTPRKPPDIAVTIDMGDDFAVQGHGLTTRLGGQIEVRSNANSGGQPRITGEIRTVQGRYRAYGQQLDVDSGIARFNGPYDNPSLDILAIRPNLQTQKAGVRITGTAQSPRVALYSDPTLTDAETLSWMMLGRSTAGGGAEAALMQQAALALLGGFGPKGGGGNFASRFGLDEIGFKGPASGEDARSSAVTLGKRLSNEVYVTYEASLAGALGTLYVFYDLTRRLALRGQAGARGAIDLIYTVTYD